MPQGARRITARKEHSTPTGQGSNGKSQKEVRGWPARKSREGQNEGRGGKRRLGRNKKRRPEREGRCRHKTRRGAAQRRSARPDPKSREGHRGHSLTEAQEQTKTRAAAAKHTLGEGSTGLEEVGRPSSDGGGGPVVQAGGADAGRVATAGVGSWFWKADT